MPPSDDRYQAYDYLEAGQDFERFEFGESRYDESTYRVPLTAAEEERAKQLSNEVLTVSLHDHPFYLPSNVTDDCREYFNQNRIWTAHEELVASNLDVVFDNLVNGFRDISLTGDAWKWDPHIEEIMLRMSDLAHQDHITQCRDVDDIQHAAENGRVGWIPALEGAPHIENDLDRLDQLYGLGVRMSGLTMNDSSYLASGMIATGDDDGGLTYLGEHAVDRMNRLGMAIDLTHSSDQTILDVSEVTDRPVFLSHVGARELWPNQKTKPDDCLERVADTGGVIGVAASPSMSSTRRDSLSFAAIMDHFDYLVDLVGIDHVTFGPDLVYGDTAALDVLYHQDPERYARLYGTDIEGHGFAPGEDATQVGGFHNPSEAWENILRWLVKHEYSDAEIRKVLGQNTLRVLKHAWE